MAKSKGKTFESKVVEGFRNSFKEDYLLVRLYDTMGGLKGVKNMCDFLFFKAPHLVCIECKSTQTDIFPLKNISENQMLGLHNADKVAMTIPGIMLWFAKQNDTVFIPIDEIERWQAMGKTSIHYKDLDSLKFTTVPAVKKAVYSDYDMKRFIDCLYEEEYDG